MKFVVSLTIVNDDPSVTIVNNDPSITIVNYKPSLMIVNDDPSLTIVNDDPSLTIVNEEGICTYHWVVFKKIARSFNSSTTVKIHVRRHSIKLQVIFFPKTTILIKFVVSLTIVNDNPSLTIVNNDPSLTIVNIIVNNFDFQKRLFLKAIVFLNNRIRNGRKSFFKNDSF